ncbi:MAG: SH3 domain-containing protein [Candidatus Devosia phytovorans]|uniref:SH3 domain-containing protein n=1 Tax=Candidatus Devosia phytovorans TaxID=3121372 RepID=A0AAJ5VV87_9HYPH|nr:SH3 domain-containing protein [Devosia sp.]WEK04024.1 MAG: SH3 domain-containing protein [Devosia sp.]
MFDETVKPIIARHCVASGARFFRHLSVFVLVALLLVPAAHAQANNPSGLPLPRFVTTRSEPINVRVGPGERYDIVWTYVKSGVPVEIIQEFDTWRKIRDIDGDEGWIHQNLLVGTRAGYVTPIMANAETPLLSNRSAESSVRAQLGPGLKVTIKECDGTWCEVSASGQAPNQRNTTYSGFMHQDELWGVYPEEAFD